MKKRAGTVDELAGRHPGSTMLVIGNSQSLNELDISLFDYFLTLGVNRLLRIYRPTYLYIGDRSAVDMEIERMVAYRETVCLIIHQNGLDGRRRKALKGQFLYAGDMTSAADPVAKWGPLCTGEVGNSGYQATQMAYRMGATRILLAGVDLVWPRGKPSHFFGYGAKEKCKLAEPEKTVQGFARLKDLYSQKGVSLASVSPWKTPLRRSLGYVPLDEAARDVTGNAAGCIRAEDL